MRSYRTTLANCHHQTRIHPALTSFADECCGTLARLVAYLGVLALLAILGIHLWDRLPAMASFAPPARTDWAVATRSYPAFAVSQLDSSGKTETYEILRHPQGGRKDVFRWAAPGEKPVAELEIYRPGGELSAPAPAIAGIASRIEPAGRSEPEAAEIIDSKFGAVMLLHQAGAAGCLGFFKRLDQANLRISGWSCQGDSLPARRSAIGCMLDRLVLLTSGNEPKLAELFARAELRRGDCPAGGTPLRSADWITTTEDPLLRGPL